MGAKLSLPWYRWFAKDWLSCETRLEMSLAEHGFYRDCLDLNFTRGSLPASPELLCKLTGVSRREFNRVSARVLSEFQPDLGQAWNAVRTLRDAERRALAEDPNSVGVLLLGQWRINLEKIACGRSVEPDSLETAGRPDGRINHCGNWRCPAGEQPPAHDHGQRRVGGRTRAPPQAGCESRGFVRRSSPQGNPLPQSRQALYLAESGSTSSCDLRRRSRKLRWNLPATNCTRREKLRAIPVSRRQL